MVVPYVRLEEETPADPRPPKWSPRKYQVNPKALHEEQNDAPSAFSRPASIEVSTTQPSMQTSEQKDVSGKGASV